MHETRRKLAAVLVALVAISCIDAAVLWRTRDRHLGIHEDHFDKGVLLYQTGSMSMGSKPMVFRPPGYPVFVAATLALKDAALGIVRPLPSSAEPRGGRRVAVLTAHAVLLGVLGAAILWFLLDRSGTFLAAACALSVACNPLLLILAGHVSYELLHLVLITIATLLLLRRAEAGAPGGAAMFANGLLWGVATLVKSVTLVAPAFILVWASLHFGLRKAARATAFFSAGLLLVVGPYTARNYVVADRFIPVNEQAPFALWATSLERIPPGASYLDWVNIWFASAMKTYTEVTGSSDYRPAVFEDHVLELSDRFRLMAAENLRRDPTIYAYNVRHNGVAFIVDSPTSFFFSHYAWPHAGGAAVFPASLSVSVITWITVIAAVIGCSRRNPRWTLLLTLFAMMWVTHALTFLDARYLYVKLPTILAGFVLAGVDAPSDGMSRWRRGIVALAAALSIAGLLAL